MMYVVEIKRNGNRKTMYKVVRQLTDAMQYVGVWYMNKNKVNEIDSITIHHGTKDELIDKLPNMSVAHLYNV